MSNSRDYPKIEGIIRGKIKKILIYDNYDDVLRLAHSIIEGKVSGSLIMSKLGSYSSQNKLATALREMGSIEKTIYILDYISNEALRRRVQKGLNKGEAMNGLARAIFFGKRGELMQHISPLGWEHMNFLGEYSFDINKTTNLSSFRPLIS